MVTKKTAMSIVLNVDQFIQDVENRPAIWNRNYHCNKFFMEQVWEELSQMHKLPVRTLKVKWKGLRDNFRVEYKRMPRNDEGELLINPENHDSKWAHFHALLFLTEHMRQRNHNTLGNLLEHDDVQNNEEECVVEPDLVNGLVQNDYDANNEMQHQHQPEHNYRIKLDKPNATKMHEGPHDLTTNQSLISKKFRMDIDVSQRDIESTKWMASPAKFYPAPLGIGVGVNNSPMLQNDDDYFYLMSLYPYMKLLNPSQKLRVRTKIQKLILKDLFKEDLD